MRKLLEVSDVYIKDGVLIKYRLGYEDVNVKNLHSLKTKEPLTKEQISELSKLKNVTIESENKYELFNFDELTLIQD